MAQDENENRQLKDVERLGEGKVRLTDSNGDQHEGPVGELPNDLTDQIVDGWMRQEDYTEKTQELSKVDELENQMEELDQKIEGFQGGSQSGSQPGQMPQQGNPNAPGGFNAGAASQGSNQMGQPQGTAGNQQANPSDVQFEGFEPDANQNNQQPNQQAQQNPQMQQIAQATNYLMQKEKKREQQKQEQQQISRLQDKYPNFTREKGVRAFNSLPDSEKKELQGLPKSKKMEIAFNRTSNGPSGSDATQEGQQTPRNDQPSNQQGQPQGDQSQPANPPYAGAGNTSGPSGSPQANNVAQSDDEIAARIEQNGIGQQTEEEAQASFNS